MGWKKLKEVFGMAGVVKRADVKEDKDGKSRGMGTVTFEQPLEAVQAICILLEQNGEAEDKRKKALMTILNLTYSDILLDSGLSHVQWTDAL